MKLIDLKIICVLITILLPTTAFAEKALIGKYYNHNLPKSKFILLPKTSFIASATYEWSICNEQNLKQKMQEYYIKPIETLTSHHLKWVMRFTASLMNSSKEFHTKKTLLKIGQELNIEIKPLGLCVRNIKIIPYNKAIKKDV